MADLDTFRRETRAWLLANAPKSMCTPLAEHEEPCWGGRKATYPSPDVKRWLDVMAARGWTAPTWPTEYGGGGLSASEARVLGQEMARAAAAPAAGRLRPDHDRPDAAPARHRGAEARRTCRRSCAARSAGARATPSRARAPTSPACRRARCVDGDDFVVNGQKIWTSYADQADWMFLLVRTDPDAPKHEGITFLLMDMSSPGVSVKPIQLISGYSPFCETFLDDVRVPRTQVVGRGQRGLDRRQGAARPRAHDDRRHRQGLRRRRHRRAAPSQLARDYLGERDGRIADAALRDRMAQVEMDQRCLDWTLARSRDTAKAGHAPGPETSIFKFYGTELNKRRRELMVSILGPQALGWEGDGFDPEELELTRDWLRSRGNSIEGGTSEIQLNIIAKRVLGLPD